ncbi:MAG: MFS transporter [Acidobacteria bacterium]|nr:MFS transporter [Acidobacteriota bacterium]MBI3426399.1 MFS transporter [Acidobacteriota bacterium]
MSEPLPTHTRQRVLWLLYALAVITYLDRVCIAAAAPAITAEFGFTPTQMGYVFSAFTVAYAAFEIPSGWLGDRYGTRLALTRIVLWWSLFTALTGAVFGFWSLFAIRFLFGAGEAGAFPNIARSVADWLPQAEQGRGMSMSFRGLATGAALSAPLVLTLQKWQGWRWTFVEFGLLGAAWAVVWYRWFRNKPEEHPAVNAAEVALIRGGATDAKTTPQAHHVPWRALFTSRNMATICGMYFAYAYSLYFYLTWLPTYLIKARGFPADNAKWYAALPWVLSIGTFWFGGWLTDRLARTHGLKIARCGVGACGYERLVAAGRAASRKPGRRGGLVGVGLVLPVRHDQRGLVGVSGCRAAQCGRGDGLYEFIRQHRRRAGSVGGGLRGGEVQFVGAAVLCDGRCFCGGRADVAAG